MGDYSTDFRVGSCMVQGSTGSSVAPVGYRRGIVSATARSAAGVYSVTLGDGVIGGANRFEHQATLQVEGGAGNTNAQLAWTSDVLLAVTTFVAAVATDATFKLTLDRVKP
jgi:hypothetical protein